MRARVFCKVAVAHFLTFCLLIFLSSICACSITSTFIELRAVDTGNLELRAGVSEQQYNTE